MAATNVDLDVETIAERLESIRTRIDAACRRSGRSPEEVTLIAVSKTFPVEFIQAASSLGIEHFGENRVQEFLQKVESVPSRVAGGSTTWHMIGHLQRNKAKDVVRYADLFHALDSRRLANELNKRAEAEGRRLPCFVEVNVSGEASKFGLAPETVVPFLNDLGSLDNLEIVGLMTLAAPVDDPEDVRPQFRLLRELLEASRRSSPAANELRYLSMGMSGDFEIAIEEGATHVRIGSAIFGERES